MSSSSKTARFIFLLENFDILQILFHLTGESFQNNKLCACPHTDAYTAFTQLKRQHSARKHPNISHNFSATSLSLMLALLRQPIFCAAAHYAGWWLSPCQLTVQLAYLRLAKSLILAGERTVYTYWCPQSYALACTWLIVKQLEENKHCVNLSSRALYNSNVSHMAASSHTFKTLLIHSF